EPGPLGPGTRAAVGGDSGVDDAGTHLGRVLRAEPDALQIAGAAVGVEDVGAGQQRADPRSVLGLLRVQDRGAHTDLAVDVPVLDLRLVRAPDVEYVGAVQRECATGAGPRQRTGHAQGADAVQRLRAAVRQWLGGAVADLGDLDQRGVGEVLGVVRLAHHLLGAAHHGDDRARLRRGLLQIAALP